MLPSLKLLRSTRLKSTAQTRFKLSGSRIFFRIWDKGNMRCEIKKDDVWRWNFGAKTLRSKVMAKKPKSARIWWIPAKKLQIALDGEPYEVHKNQIQIWKPHFVPKDMSKKSFEKTPKSCQNFGLFFKKMTNFQRILL